MTSCCTCSNREWQSNDEFLREIEGHGNEGIQRDELETTLLHDDAYTHVISARKWKRLLDRADEDRDRFITFPEFKNMYEKFGLSQAERTAMKRFLGAALVNIVPRAWRTDFLRNYNCRPPPFFMPVVSLLEVGVFIYYAILLGRGGRPVTAFEGLPNPNVLMYVPTRRYEAWRYITYMLVHQGYIHLLFNLSFQLFLGLPLEIVHKWWRVALVYVGGVVGGSLAHSVTDISVNLAGASGGCYAIIGAHIASVILNWKEMNFKCSAKDPVRLLTSAYVRLTLLVLLIGADAVNAVYRRFYEPDNFKVGITAHIGGFLTGLLLGVIVLKNVNILSWERRIGWAALAIWLAAILVCILINGLRTGYPETDFTSIYSQF